MSSSALPRIYFDGHFSWNPSTNNNDDYSVPTDGTPPFAPPLVPFDPASGTPNWPWLREQSFEGQPVTSSNFRQWSWDDEFSIGDGRSLPPSEWNFFGGMECGFVTDEFPVLEQPPNPDPDTPGTPVFDKPTGDDTTRVTGYTATDGSFTAKGSPVGLDLQFNTAPSAPFTASPKLIDVNPQSPFTSQIFADDVRLGDGTNGFASPLAERMHSRWLYFKRNLNQDNRLMIAGIASTVFQTGLRNEDIEWAGDSPVLAELREAAAVEVGVMFRMATYDTCYFNGPYFGQQGDDQFPSMLKMRNLYVQYFNDLERYKHGLLAEPPPAPCNRAYSRTVGWLGVWRHGEFVTIPGGRMLLPTILPFQPEAEPSPAQVYPQAVVKQNPPSTTGSGFPFGPATVERDADFTRLTVDLISTIPELDSSGKIAPFGPIGLGIVLDGTCHRLATVVDDSSTYRDRYLQFAGLVDIPVSELEPIDGSALTPEQFDANPLVLTANSYTYDADQPPSSWPATEVCALTENGLNAQTDTRGLYVDEPDAGSDEPSTVFTVDVRSFGSLPTTQVGLVVAQYSDQFDLLSGDERVLDISYRTPSGSWVPIDSDTVVDASSGTVTVGLRGRTGPSATTNGALPYLALIPVATAHVPAGLSPEHPVGGFATTELSAWSFPANMTSAGYAAVRLWPYHSHQLATFEQYLETGPSVDEVNNWVFANVYETFHLMYPVMDFIGTPQKFQAWRGRILEVTKPANFATSGYMPPTRTLSGAQRRILERYDDYLDNVSAPGGALRTLTTRPPTPRRG